MNAGFREGRPRKFSNAQIELASKLLNEYSYKQVEQMTGISSWIYMKRKTSMNL